MPGVDFFHSLRCSQELWFSLELEHFVQINQVILGNIIGAQLALVRRINASFYRHKCWHCDFFFLNTTRFILIFNSKLNLKSLFAFAREAFTWPVVTLHTTTMALRYFICYCEDIPAWSCALLCQARLWLNPGRGVMSTMHMYDSRPEDTQTHKDLC